MLRLKSESSQGKWIKWQATSAYLLLWSTHPMHCLSCSNNSNFALFCLLYHVLYIYIKKTTCGSLTCCHCHALGCEIRLCSESNWVHFHASQQNDIYFSDFFFIFSYRQLRARHNYFHQGPQTLSGGGLGGEGAKHSDCTCQEVSLFLHFYQCSSSRSFAGVKSSWIFKRPLNLRKRWNNFSSKKEKSAIKKFTGDVLWCFFF